MRLLRECATPTHMDTDRWPLVMPWREAMTARIDNRGESSRRRPRPRPARVDSRFSDFRRNRDFRDALPLARGEESARSPPFCRDSRHPPRSQDRQSPAPSPLHKSGAKSSRHYTPALPQQSSGRLTRFFFTLACLEEANPAVYAKRLFPSNVRFVTDDHLSRPALRGIFGAG